MAGGLVVMDIGDVLLATVPGAHYRALARLVGRPEAEVAAAVAEDALAFELGELSADELAAAVAARLGSPVDADQLEAAWAEVIGPTDPLVTGAAARLAAAGRLLLASNTNAFHWRLIQPRLGTAGIAAPACLSFVVGAMKPAPAYYAALTAADPRVVPGTVFIDDKPENAAGAAAHGLTAWVHTDPAETAARLSALL